MHKKMLNHFKKTKENLESVVLDSMGYPYILFDTEGAFVRAHCDICDILLALGFGENEMRYPVVLASRLKSIEWQGAEALQHYHRNKMMSVMYTADVINFAGLIKHKRSIFYVHMQQGDAGGFAVFKDIYGDYLLNRACEMLSRTSKGVGVVLQSHSRVKPAVQDNKPLYSLAGNV